MRPIMKKARAKKKAPPRPARRPSDDSFIHLMLNVNPLPAFLTDLTDYRFLDVNEAAVKKYGYSRSEFLRMKLTEIRPPEDVARLKDYTSKRLKGLTDAGLWRHRLKNGKII